MNDKETTNENALPGNDKPKMANVGNIPFSPNQSENAAPPLTFGQKAVGITFNPGGSSEVDRCKQQFANCIDQMDAFRNRPDATPEQKRLASIAITELQGAQMWAVKALTWRD